jgi:hypothetical protein
MQAAKERSGWVVPAGEGVHLCELPQVMLLGIDPGVTTGIARWCASNEQLLSVGSMTILQAMDAVYDDRTQTGLVILEDCREMRIGGGKTFGDTARLQGVGSVKRDCQIWCDFLADNQIPFITQKPNPTLTKWKADRFKATTGWQKLTNEHARDAAMLVYGFTEHRAQILLATATRRAA